MKAWITEHTMPCGTHCRIIISPKSLLVSVDREWIPDATYREIQKLLWRSILESELLDSEFQYGYVLNGKTVTQGTYP